MKSRNQFTLPGPDDRTLIIGRTGSGKTQFGLWLLAQVHDTEDRTIIIDYKREHNIAQIPYAQYMSVDAQLPREPGVYIVQPFPTQDAEVSDLLMRIWDEENIRLYIDEGVMLARNDALDTILIQGRSKNIPVIMLTQRPVGISRFAFSESQLFVVFPSHDRRERKIISEFTPLFTNREDMGDVLLPAYHSYYYNVVTRELHTLKPVPMMDQILAQFAVKLRPPEPLEQPGPGRAMRRIVPI